MFCTAGCWLGGHLGCLCRLLCGHRHPDRRSLELRESSHLSLFMASLGHSVWGTVTAIFALQTPCHAVDAEDLRRSNVCLQEYLPLGHMRRPPTAAEPVAKNGKSAPAAGNSGAPAQPTIAEDRSVRWPSLMPHLPQPVKNICSLGPCFELLHSTAHQEPSGKFRCSS